MQKLTLRVISGADRGRVYHEISTPLTIGREEGNTIQLNDERVSRFHVKIQEDDGRLVVTDLESTNGTRVNGHPCSLKILRYGDTIAVGRSVLVVGTREQVAAWFSEGTTSNIRNDSPMPVPKVDSDSVDMEFSTGLVASKSSSASAFPVCVPKGLSPGQAAELRELLDYLHSGMRGIIDNAASNDDQSVTINAKVWQQLVVIQSDVAELIREIEDPSE